MSAGILANLLDKLRRGLVDRKILTKLALASSNTRKVDFVIAGAQRCGTSALNYQLRYNPDICTAFRKKVHFFDDEDNFRDGRADYSLYHSFFNPTAQHKVLGEATPSYMYWLPTPRRLWEYNPGLKLIIVLRNPITRAFSAWNMRRTKGQEDLPFWDALQAESERLRRQLPLQDKRHSYVDMGHYLCQLRRLWTFFPREQCLILKHDDFKNDALSVLNRIAGFLNVAPFASAKSVEYNSKPYAAEMSERERTHLHSIFQLEIRALERELGWDCSNWLKDERRTD